MLALNLLNESGQKGSRIKVNLNILPGAEMNVNISDVTASNDFVVRSSKPKSFFFSRPTELK